VGAIYRLLAASPDVDWSKWHFFWGDERCVELDNPYSNYKLAAETLFTPADILRYGQVYPVMQSMVPPPEAALRYEATIRKFFEAPAGEWPVFDLCLNGMGPDGHTASLFPRAPAGRSKTRVAKMAHAGHQPWVDRVTLTVPVFNHARCVVVCATGTDKAERLKAVLEGPLNPHMLPAQFLNLPALFHNQVNGDVIWMLEPGIAQLLQSDTVKA
jgi:6-phosphogluconolactonase